jgi:hypothetical protein
MSSQFYTAKQMAMMSHNLSRDGMSATIKSGEVYKWSDHFKVWAGPYQWTKGDARKPR